MPINESLVIPHWGWIGVDFDRTLAKYARWQGPEVVGEPILPMVDLVRELLGARRDVRVFTGRIWPLIYVPVNENEGWVWMPGHGGTAGNAKRNEDAITAAKAIRTWTFEQFGTPLALTNIKDFSMSLLFDDIARQVRENTGEVVQ